MMASWTTGQPTRTNDDIAAQPGSQPLWQASSPRSFLFMYNGAGWFMQCPTWAAKDNRSARLRMAQVLQLVAAFELGLVQQYC